MSDTAVAIAPVVVGGVNVMDPTLTPQERFNAFARVHGAPEVAVPAGRQGPHETWSEGTRTAPVNAPPSSTTSRTPPTPQELEASRGTRLESFEREMRDNGLQKPLQPASVPADQVDQRGIEALNKAYRALTPSERDAKRGQYREELREFYEGRQYGESRKDFQNRKRATDATADFHAAYGLPPPQTYTPQQWEKEHKSVTDADGWIALDRINPAALSGYTLPKLVDGQRYNSATFGMLAHARKVGFTQEQVNAYIREQMRADGWIKV